MELKSISQFYQNHRFSLLLVIVFLQFMCMEFGGEFLNSLFLLKYLLFGIISLIIIETILFFNSSFNKTDETNFNSLIQNYINYKSQLVALDKSQAVIEFALDGTILKCNENFLNAMSYSWDEIKGKNHKIFVEPRLHNSEEYREFWNILQRGKYHKAEYKRIGKNGKEVYIQATYNPILDSENKPIKVVKFATDITAQKILSLESEKLVEELVLNLGKMEVGDFNVRINGEYSKGFLAIKNSFNVTLSKLNSIISKVFESVDEVLGASKEVDTTAQSLSQASTRQAATVEETEASLNQMINKLEETAKNAKESETTAKQSALDAENGERAVNKSVDAMKNISEKIGVIREIASQTSLLSLNASIEAARAGSSGSGFAVVAFEVGKLADVSNESANEIGKLTESSVKIVNAAGALISEIIPAIAKTSEIVKSISKANSEQFITVSEIGEAMKELDRVTQQNAAIAEELAATSSSLRYQAYQLQEQVSFFKK